MMKLFTLLVRKCIVIVRTATAENDATVIGCTTNTVINNNHTNDPATAGSLSFIPVALRSPNGIPHINNSFMKTVVRKAGIFAIALIVANLFLVEQSAGQGSQTFSTAGTFTFTVPAGVTSVKVECWGGGAGGNNTNNLGGGGGAFAGNNAVTVTPGSGITITVGAGGDANALPNIGGNSSFGAFVIAAGANAGVSGSAGASTGTIVFSGGNGGSSTSTGGAGGGGSAGAGGAGGIGGNSNNSSGGAAGAAGAAGSGTAGAVGGAGGSSNSAGNNGTAPGGGGGERGSSGSASGVGAVGRVRITWTCPAATISYGALSLCKSATSVGPTLTGSTGGTFSSTAGLTINTSTGIIDPSASTATSYTVHYQIAGGSGCSAVDATAPVTVVANPIASVTDQSNITCFVGSDGTITVKAAGGTTPYSFSVNDGANWQAANIGADQSKFSGLLPNTAYRIRVKDNNGCISH